MCFEHKAGQLKRHGRAPWKLTAENVRAIKRSLGKESQLALAVRYGVSQAMISKIARGAAWAHLEV